MPFGANIRMPGIPGFSDALREVAGLFGMDVPGSEGATIIQAPGEGRRPPSRPTKSGGKKKVKKKGGKKPKTVPAYADPTAALWPGVVGAAGAVPAAGSGIDYDALAAQMGIDPALLEGLRPNVGNLIPLALSRQGARPMADTDIDELVSTMVGDRYSRMEQLAGRDREDMRRQNEHNLAQIERWYNQVLGSQGVAAERDAAFGRAAVDSARGATEAIVGALGGEANMGAGVVGAAGNENVGNLQAISTVQDQFNADMAPLLRGEMAGQLAREQALGGARLRDLSRRLQELQAERGSKEAELRFAVWQSNNDILDRRLQNELAIRQANAALHQQRFQNRMGVRQMGLAAATAGMEGLTDLAGVAQEDAEAQGNLANKAADRQFRAALEAAKEAGRNYRARLSAQSRGRSESKLKPYGASSADAKDSAWNDIVDALDGRELTPQQALRVGSAIVSGYGWSMKNAAVQSLVRTALREAGYDV